MDEVDREVATKEPEDIEDLAVDREGSTVDPEALCEVDRSSETKVGERVDNVLRIEFLFFNVPANNTSLFKGIPFSEPQKVGISKHLLFGRGHSVDIFFNDDTVSREHMKLFLQSGYGNSKPCFAVETVSAKMPVYINNQPVYKRDGVRRLQTNDKLCIGKLAFFVRILPGDSRECYQVEFIKSEGNIPGLQPNLGPTPIIPGNPTVTIGNIGNASFFNQSVPYNPHGPHNGVPVFGTPVTPQYPTHVLPGQQHPMHQSMAAPFVPHQLSYQSLVAPAPHSQALPSHGAGNMVPSGINGAFSQHHPANVRTDVMRPSAQDRRERFQHKQPSEHNETDDCSTFPVQETRPPSKHPNS